MIRQYLYIMIKPYNIIILSDIESKESYVLLDDNEIIGTAYLFLQEKFSKQLRKSA